MVFQVISATEMLIETVIAESSKHVFNTAKMLFHFSQYCIVFTFCLSKLFSYLANFNYTSGSNILFQFFC